VQHVFQAAFALRPGPILGAGAGRIRLLTRALGWLSALTTGQQLSQQISKITLLARRLGTAAHQRIEYALRIERS
jgi:hypothetical protein